MTNEKAKPIRQYCWMAAYFLLGSAIPLLILWLEYGNAPGTTKDFIPYVLKAYSPLFVYGWLIGFCLPLFIVPAYDFFKNAIRDKVVNRTRIFFTVTAICISLIVTVADFFGGEPAIWEVKPPHHQNYVAHFINANDTTSKEAKIFYANGLTQSLTKFSNWSATRISYIFSVFIEALFLNIFFCTCVLYSFFRTALKRIDEIEFYKRINGLIISSMIIFVWLLFRSANYIEKLRLYPSARLQITDAAVGILNIFCLSIIVLARISDRKIKQRAQEILSLLATGGVTAGSVLAFFHRSTIDVFFGKKAGMINFIVIPIFFICIYIAYHTYAIAVDFKKRYGIREQNDEI